MCKRNVIVIIGIETIRDQNGTVKRFSDTFLDNALTYRKDHPKDEVKFLDARNYVKCSSPMKSMWDDLIGAFGLRGIDELVYMGHSDSEILYVFSRTRTDLDNDDRFINSVSDWSNVLFNSGAVIRLFGCQTGGQQGKRWTECIAQWIANATGIKTFGYVWRSSQKYVNGGYYQLPEHGKFVEFNKE